MTCNVERLVDIRSELVKLKRSTFPNAGAVLLRVFFELAVVNYLKESGALPKLIARLKAKNKLLPRGMPSMKDMMTEMTTIAKAKLSSAEANAIAKALQPDKAAPFSIGDLHSFVHSDRDLPSERDIYQFWIRTEPLFRMMVEQPIEVAAT